jgi:carbamate kinase
MSKVAVVAVGGNSLIKDDQHRTVPDQFAATRKTALHITEMIKQGWDVVITHGNGPQVGFILLRSELASHVLHPVPLDSCGADTQGALGYMIQQCLYNEFLRQHVPRLAATVVTQVIVDENDPAFTNPTKPIGPFLDEEKARRYQADHGWTVREDAGRGWRRVVPSPRPLEIVERDAIQQLIRSGYAVIAVGGGGVPVVRHADGTLHGVEAVIDKDYASALLALTVRADLFLISTAIDRVAINYRKPDEQFFDRLPVGEAERYLAQGHFPAGSMGPKIEACIQFIRQGGTQAIITSPEQIADALAGKAGTRIVAG